MRFEETETNDKEKNDACSLNPLTLQWLDDVAISYNTALAFFVTWSYKNTVTVCRIEFLQYSSVWCMAYIICTLPVGKISVQDILSWSAFPRRLFCRLQERLTERKITKTKVFKNLTKGGWGVVVSRVTEESKVVIVTVSFLSAMLRAPCLRKVCFGELFNSLSRAALDIFLIDILYLWKPRRVVVEFPCVVASWFRQNFDQIESIFYLFLYFFKYMFFSRF